MNCALHSGTVSGDVIFNMASVDMDSEAKNESKECFTLEEQDILGAELPRPAELCSVAILKRWLSCRGAKVSGKRSELIER